MTNTLPEPGRPELLSFVIHQLRSPLTTVKLALETILEDTDSLSAQHVHLLEQTLRNVLDMHTTTATILSYEALEQLLFVIAPEKHSLQKLIEDTVARMQLQLQSKQLTVTIKKPASAVDTTFDSGKIQLVLTNLIDNAIRYTPPQGTITISLDQTNNASTIVVADTGVGVSEHQREHLFSKFKTVSEHGKEQLHWGLGLYVAKQIIEAHSGSIRHEPNTPTGAQFIITLP